MKKSHLVNILLILVNLSIVIIVASTSIEEYRSDFPYWGYEQWPWFYKNKMTYAIYNSVLFSLMCLCIIFGIIRMHQEKKYYNIILSAPLFYLIFQFINTTYFHNI